MRVSVRSPVTAAVHREGYIDGLTRFRAGDINGWIEQFAIAAAQASRLAEAYLERGDGAYGDVAWAVGGRGRAEV
jgi:hypothetical protein